MQRVKARGWKGKAEDEEEEEEEEEEETTNGEEEAGECLKLVNRTRG